MVNVHKRMRALKTLLALKLGPGAATFTPSVKRIHMSFAFKSSDGHLGPRKFWRLYLPRLKYYNPAIPMTISRNGNQTGPAVMEVVFKSMQEGISKEKKAKEEASDAIDPGALPLEPGDRVERINMKGRNAEEILSDLLQVTKATEVEPSEEDKRDAQRLEEQRQLSEKEKKLSLELRLRKQRELEILDIAKGNLEKSTEVA
ncbi:MAG: hypothetical protein M1834_003047 [Cirrosporium novae-zelandiae]|nr:MAG: hypothetical protein M1834_003047 [Cirrosporium novae-zelandiae]